MNRTATLNGAVLSCRQLEPGQKIINFKYTVLYKIAQQAHSRVYSITTRKNGKQIARAIKMQQQTVQFPQVNNETQILKTIFDENEFQLGFPKIYEFGQIDNQNYMVTSFLGPNLAQLHRLCNNRFSIHTCLLVGLQILDRIQTIHQIGYVYRDIRLQNFAIGLEDDSAIIFMIDMGHCQKYKINGTHKPYKQGNKNIDDSTFMSINIHNNIHYSRRDDIESLLYLIIFMLKGRLPWKKVEAKSKKQKDEIIGGIKKSVSPSYLAYNFGLQMADIIWYVRTLNYYEKPDYDYIRTKMYQILQAKAVDKNQIEIKYDWNQRQDMDFTIYTGEPKLFLNKVERIRQSLNQAQKQDQIKDQVHQLL